MTKPIYEDGDIAAFNKPSGVIFDWILAERPELIPAHRLDKDTSGVILFAKHQEAADHLKKLFQAREIKKTYITLVVGSVKVNEGVIDLPIGRSAATPLKRVAIGKMRGKIREAVTEYKVLERYEGPAQSHVEGFTLVEACPKTGRMHQIRSHFAAIGHPVACDKLYSGKRFLCPSGIVRQFLHAAAVELTLPSGGRIKLEAELAPDLAEALSSLAVAKIGEE